ncbi:MAG: hypothetical protein WKF92_14865 [Pyrinomonadaceae bacterium]
MSEKFLTREELYDRVWQKAAVYVAGELGLSDVALGKICRKMNIPKPPRGYWAMIEAGQKIRRAHCRKRRPQPLPGTI